MQVFSKEFIEESIVDWPSDYIPKSSIPFIHTDHANGEDYSCTIRGYYEKGIMVIQDITYDTQG